jgi:hypothetical protein
MHCGNMEPLPPTDENTGKYVLAGLWVQHGSLAQVRAPIWWVPIMIEIFSLFILFFGLVDQLIPHLSGS